MEVKAVGLWVQKTLKSTKIFPLICNTLPLHAECSPCMHLVFRSVIPTLLFTSCEFFPFQSTDFTPPSTPPGKLLSCECPRFLKNVETPWFILFLYCYLQFLIPVPLRPLLMQSVPNGGFLCSSSEMWLCGQGLQPSSQHSFLLFSRGEVSRFPPLHHQPDFIIIT